ncbi:hypothetical protein CYMTET_4661 [Cymbomonas tetramitiformis]|uniref:Uncharacterized protein n=1 Tax=Cymbomonas tetramitiformis TaxID=36881 RepID=A0AAE0H0Y0_9CHLO|nr:hypothetical protein CYMTET_4661 [Cymbomonas tetramitiformis]
MQAAYDDEDDDAFCEICDAFGKAEVHKGPSANTFPSAAGTTVREPSLRQQYCGLKELSGGRFAPIEPTVGAHSFVTKDATVTAAPPVVSDKKKPQLVVDKKIAFRTASVVHNDDRDLWRDWESPVMDMTPTQECGHFDSFTVAAEDAIGDSVDDADVFEDALPEEVVFDPPAECDATFIEDFSYAPHQHFRKSEIDKFYPPLLLRRDWRLASPTSRPRTRMLRRSHRHLARGLVVAASPACSTPPPLLTTLFFSAFMAYVEELVPPAQLRRLDQTVFGFV